MSQQVIAAIIDGVIDELKPFMENVKFIRSNNSLVIKIGADTQSKPVAQSFLLTIRFTADCMILGNQIDLMFADITYDYADPQSLDKIVEQSLSLYKEFVHHNNA